MGWGRERVRVRKKGDNNFCFRRSGGGQERGRHKTTLLWIGTCHSINLSAADGSSRLQPPACTCAFLLLLPFFLPCVLTFPPPPSHSTPGVPSLLRELLATLAREGNRCNRVFSGRTAQSHATCARTVNSNVIVTRYFRFIKIEGGQYHGKKFLLVLSK